MKLKMNLSSLQEYYLRVLTLMLLSTDARISPQTLEFLSRFLALPRELNYAPFSPKAKRMVSASYNKKMSAALMSLRIKNLIDAGLIKRDEDGFLEYSPSIKKVLASTSFTLDVTYNPTTTKTDG